MIKTISLDVYQRDARKAVVSACSPFSKCEARNRLEKVVLGGYALRCVLVTNRNKTLSLYADNP